MQLLPDAAALSARFPVWLCDIWGVIHDGVRCYPRSPQALAAHRARGGAVVLISNAPRPAHSVIAQLDKLGCPRAAYDAVVTSGDITLELAAARGGQSYFLVGPPDKDRHLIERISNTRVADAAQAGFILCTGLDDDETESVADYAARLEAWAALKLPMICANPDRVVNRGDRLIPCAGALADAYAALGGEVLMAGKPFAPIYEAAIARARQILPQVQQEQILAVGDGIVTDAEGSRNQGLAFAFITGGIHGAEFGSAEAAAEALQARLPGIRLSAVLAELA